METESLPELVTGTSPRQTVESALAHLLALEEQKAALESPFKAQIEALRATIKEQIATLEGGMEDATYTLDMEIAHETKTVEELGPQVGATVKAQGERGSISSVYIPETYTIDKKKFAGFAVNHPEAWQITEPVPARIQIRRGK